MTVRPFEIAWSGAEIEAMKRRLTAMDMPPVPAGAGWLLGCDTDFLERFRRYLIEAFDWAAAQRTLNRYPQFIAEVDGIDIHFVHVKGERAGARPLVLTHGWPGSHFEFWDCIERLTQPSLHGGSAEDAFDLIIPTLPGYGYSGRPDQPIGPATTARLWDRLVTEVLGYDAYLAQGGDWGALVTAQIGMASKAVRGIHMNLVGLRSMLPARDEAEADWDAKSGKAQMMLSGYAMLQRTKPMSLALASAGNPLGQAAWILERFHDWADLSERAFEDVFPLEHLAINALLYLMPGSFGTSLWFYNGLAREGGVMIGENERCETPTGYANFPGDTLMPPPPKSRVELCFNLVHWTDMPRGGHFAAMEQPGLFVDDLFAWAETVWPPT